MAESAYLDKSGRMKAGNPGRPRGTKETAPRGLVGPRTLQRTSKDNAAAVQVAAAKHMLKALKCLGEAAETDPASAERFLRLVSPPAPPRVFLTGTAHLAHLPAEERLTALTAMVARGELDIASANSMAGLIRTEIEMRYIRPLKLAVKELEAALKTGDRRAAEDALLRLSKELGLAHTGTVEGEVVDD